MGNAGALGDPSGQPVVAPSSAKSLDIQNVESQNLPVGIVSITGAQGRQIIAFGKILAVLTNRSTAIVLKKFGEVHLQTEVCITNRILGNTFVCHSWQWSLFHISIGEF